MYAFCYPLYPYIKLKTLISMYFNLIYTACNTLKFLLKEKSFKTNDLENIL